MKIIKCKCGAQFDVASMRPGSTFACGKCRSPVHVPADSPPATVALSPDQMKKALDDARASAAATSGASASAPKGQPKLPPAMQARAQATTAGAAGARAVGAAPAAASPPVVAKAPPPAATRPAPRRGDAPDSEPVKKAPVAMYVSIAGGVLLLGVVGFLAFNSGSKSKDGKPDDVSKGPAKVEPPPPPPKPKDPTNYDDFLSMTGAEQHDALVARKVAASTDLAAMKSFHEWLTNARLSKHGEAKTTAVAVVEEAIKKDSNCDWARAAHGDRAVKELLDKCKADCPKAFSMMDAGEKTVLARLDAAEANPWADAAEWAKLDALVTAIRARNEKMSNDPRMLQSEQKKNWVRLNPVFKDVELTSIFADPYVIFQEVKKQDVRNLVKKYNDKTGESEEVPDETPGAINPARVAQNRIWAEKGELLAKRDGIIFCELNRRFRELFADRYKLPTLQDKGRILTGVVMWNRASFNKMNEDAGQPVGAGVRAFYSPPQQKIFHYISEESLQELDEYKCADGYTQKTSDQVTFHEGTHQLQHEYTAIYQGKPLKDDEINVVPRKAMWFEEGMAEFMGAAEVEDGKTEYLQGVNWRHNRILLDRIDESRRQDFKEHVRMWTIKEFLKPNDNQQLQQVGDRIAPGYGMNMSSHFYCRAWAFCHFLWYYDNGKYKEKFYQYLGDVFKGSQSSEKFAKMMGRPNMNDWGDIEKEYEWYWERLLARKVGRNRVTHQYEHPATDAPTGKVEDDADFCDIWNENHKGDKK